MRSIVVEGAFGLENLKVRQREVGAPGPGEVRLRMKAASLNYRDLLMVRGHYDPRQPLPLVPLSDGVGEVVEVGAGVTRVAVGDRVCPIFAQAWHAGEPRKETMRTTLGGPLDGTLREEMCLSEEGVVPVPEHLSDAEAACLPCAAVTAWSALVTHGGVKAGDTVLVLGTGGVAVFAVQFARLLGAEVIATSSSDEKLERVRALGAAHGINYVSEPDWGKRARALTGGRGVDHVLEGRGRRLAGPVPQGHSAGGPHQPDRRALRHGREAQHPAHPDEQHPYPGHPRGTPRQLRGHEPGHLGP